MRAFVLFLALSLTGCSAFGSMLASDSSGADYDPTRVYLGDSTVTIRASDEDRYGCARGPMLCERFGTGMECRCPYR